MSISLLIFFHSVVVTIGFEESTYTVSEDENFVEVCVRVLTGTLAPGVTFEINVQTITDSALGMATKKEKIRGGF